MRAVTSRDSSAAGTRSPRATGTAETRPTASALPKRCSQRGARAAAVGKALDRRLRLVAEHELELPELIGLKAARRFEPLPKRLELERRHRLEDVELRDQHLEDGEDALQRVLRAIRIARVEQRDHAIDFVQHLLEPQLVDLVNDDEEHFVVFGSFGARPLQREQLIDRQIGSVSDGTVVHHHSLQGGRPVGGPSPVPEACLIGVNRWRAIQQPGAQFFNRLDSRR